jgi:hypothetical protein
LQLLRVQKVSSQQFSADCVGFRFLEILTLIVSIGGHREAKTNDQCEQCQRSSKDDIQIVLVFIGDIWVSAAQPDTDHRR